MQTQASAMTKEIEIVATDTSNKSVLLEKHFFKIIVVNMVIAFFATFLIFSHKSLSYDFSKMFLSIESWHQFCGWLSMCLVMAIAIFGCLTLGVMTVVEKFEMWKELNNKKTKLV